MIRTERRMRICITLLVLILAFIWGNSLLSAEASRQFSDWVKEILRLLFGKKGSGGGDGNNGLLRKIAHFTEFTALGMCLCWLFGMLRKHIGMALLSGLAAACVDELIQCFVPNRGPSILDVGLDTCGIIAGVLLLLTGHIVCKHFFGGKRI